METSLKYSIALAVFLFTTTGYFGQDSSKTKTPKGVSVSYWGNFKTRRGFSIGIEKYYLESKKYCVVGNTSLVYENRSSLSSALGVVTGSSLRRKFKLGVYSEHGVKLGYWGSYYNFDFYRSRSDGSIVNIGRKWNNAVIVGYTLGLGYDRIKISATHIRLFVKANFYYKVPNYGNVFYLNNYSFETGIVFDPKRKSNN